MTFISLLLWTMSARFEGNANPDVVLTLGRNMKLRNYGLTPTRSFPIHWQSNENAKAVTMRQSTITPNLALSDVQGAQTESIVGLETPAEIAVLYSTMQIRSTSGNSPVGTVNHTSWIIVDPKRKPLISLEQKYWSEATKQPSRIQKLRVPHFRQFGKDIWVELVVNNLDDTGHPFHLVSGLVQMMVESRDLLIFPSMDITFML